MNFAHPSSILGSAPSALLLLALGCGPLPDGDALPVLDVSELAVTIAVPGDQPTIQGALAAANPGDVVSVGPGTWVGDLTVPGGVWLVGAGPGATTIRGTVFVQWGQAGVGSMTILGPGAGSTQACGVYSGPGDSLVLVSSVVAGWYAGVCTDPGASLALAFPHVDGTLLLGNGYGALVESGEATFTNNVFESNVRAGVWGDDGVARMTVVNNTFVSNALGSPTSPQRDAAISLGTGPGGSLVRNNSMTSNLVGYHCAGCSATADHNQYWDNGQDRQGDATPHPTDVEAEPLYVDAAAGDLRPQAGSPLIDAGSPTGAPAYDGEGNPRPMGAGVDIGALEAPAAPTPPPTPALTIELTEVMANPLVEATGEFVELHNYGAVDVDLAGLSLSDGDTVDTLEAWDGGSMVLAPGGVAVILDRGYAGEYSIPEGALLLTVDDAALGNGLSTSDPVSLLDGAVVVSAWTAPFDPGNGTSAEWAPENGVWGASDCPSGASPGALECDAAPELGLVISEVMANPLNEATGEYVELVNLSAAAIDLAGLVLTDGDALDVVEAFGGSTVVPPGGHAIIVDPGYDGSYAIAEGATIVTVGGAALGNGLAASSDPVTLMDVDGGSVLATFSFPMDPGNGTSVERIDLTAEDAAGNWAPSPCGASPGGPNCAM